MSLRRFVHQAKKRNKSSSNKNEKNSKDNKNNRKISTSNSNHVSNFQKRNSTNSDIFNNIITCNNITCKVGNEDDIVNNELFEIKEKKSNNVKASSKKIDYYDEEEDPNINIIKKTPTPKSYIIRIAYKIVDNKYFEFFIIFMIIISSISLVSLYEIKNFYLIINFKLFKSKFIFVFKKYLFFLINLGY